MPDPYEALKKARTIEPEPGLVEQAIAFLVGGLGLSGVPVPTATGPARAMGDSRASRLGEAVAMLAGVPVAGVAKKGIRAFHGSPHDFDKFSLEKIGTGEGAQAYGHGLYFAEAENTARSYRDSLASKWKYDGQPIAGSASNAMEFVDHKLAAEKGIPFAMDDALRRLEKQADFYRRTYDPSPENLYTHAAERLRTLDTSKMTVPGRMYEVNIDADPETLLDWDAPLSTQPPAARGVLADLPPALGLTPGQRLYTALASRHGGEAQASEALRRAGIPGIKYLDQGSRAAGEGSRNYVIFDDSLVEIMRKYGLLPPLVAGAASEMDR